MMTMLLIAGIAVLAAGLLAIIFGVPVKEFSLGNTLILAGAVAACTGVIMLGLEVNALKGKTGPITTIKGVITSGFVLTLIMYVVIEVLTK